MDKTKYKGLQTVQLIIENQVTNLVGIEKIDSSLDSAEHENIEEEILTVN